MWLVQAWVGTQRETWVQTPDGAVTFTLPTPSTCPLASYAAVCEEKAASGPQ